MRKILFVLVLLKSVQLQSQQNSLTNAIEQNFPNKEWEYLDDPSSFGWSNDKLNQVRQFIVDSANTTGMVVVHHGKVIFTYGDYTELSYIASCRKSVLAILYGPFVENGKINLSSSLEKLNIDDVGGLLPIEKKATIQNLLNARSGVYHEASYPGDERAIAPHRGTVEPGTFFLYNNWDFNLAGYVFEKLSGVGIYRAVDSILAKPLQMEDWDLSMQHKEGDSTRSLYPAYPMWFSTRDMARIGYLMLHEGKWKEKQIISPQWVKTITTAVTSYQEAADFRGDMYKRFGYGYLWWVWDGPFDTGIFKGAYTAQGAYGQFITVIPDLDLVVAHKTNNKYERATNNYYDILDKLLAANSFVKLNSYDSMPVNIKGIHRESLHYTPSSANELKFYTGQYTNPETHVSFSIDLKDGILTFSNSQLPDEFHPVETNHDLFVTRGQKILFQRSMKTKEIIGFSIQTPDAPDMPFVKIQ